MIGICKTLATQNTQLTWVFFIFNMIFYSIAYDWENRPVTPSEQKSLEEKIIPCLKEIVEDLKEQKPIQKIANNVNILVLYYQDYGNLIDKH